MLDFIANLQENPLFQAFCIKISHSDINSPLSVTFISSINIILWNFQKSN